MNDDGHQLGEWPSQSLGHASSTIIAKGTLTEPIVSFAGIITIMTMLMERQGDEDRKTV